MEITETTVNSFLSFKLDKEIFGVNVNKVIEILEVPHITKIPKAPAFMRGVINLRGIVLPVIDSRLKFGLSSVSDSVDTCIIVFNICNDKEEIQLGALVDAVQEVFEFAEEDLRPAPDIGSKYKTEFLKGMISKQEKFVMVLDVDKVFAHEDIISLKSDLERLNA